MRGLSALTSRIQGRGPTTRGTPHGLPRALHGSRNADPRKRLNSRMSERSYTGRVNDEPSSNEPVHAPRHRRDGPASFTSLEAAYLRGPIGSGFGRSPREAGSSTTWPRSPDRATPPLRALPRTARDRRSILTGHSPIGAGASQHSRMNLRHMMAKTKGQSTPLGGEPRARSPGERRPDRTDDFLTGEINSIRLCTAALETITANVRARSSVHPRYIDLPVSRLLGSSGRVREGSCWCPPHSVLGVCAPLAPPKLGAQRRVRGVSSHADVSRWYGCVSVRCAGRGRRAETHHGKQRARAA